MKSLFAAQEVNRLQSGMKVGNTVAGRVAQNLGNNQFLVSLRGVNVMAQSDLPMIKGDRFKARIEAVKPKLLLKIISSENHAGIAEQWGLSEEETKLLDEMSASKLPLNKKNFDRINSVIKKFAKHPQLKADYGDLAKAAVKLERQGLEHTVENMSRQLTAAKGDFNLAELMGKLSAIFGDIQKKMPPELSRFVKSLPQNFTPEALHRNLPAIVMLMGLIHESDLKELLLKGKFAKQLNLKCPLLQMLAQSAETSEDISKLLVDLEAAQVRNLPENRFANGDAYYIQLPVYMNGDWEKMDMFFHSDNQTGDRIDKNNASIRINLDTKYLGKVSALTEIKNGVVNVKLYMENDDIVKFVQPHLEDLNDRLDALDYDIQSISVMTVPPNDNFDEHLPFPDSIIHHEPGMESLNLVV